MARRLRLLGHPRLNSFGQSILRFCGGSRLRQLKLKLVDSFPILRPLGRQFRIERISSGHLRLQLHHLAPEAIRLLQSRDQFGLRVLQRPEFRLRVMKRSLGSG